MLNSLISWKELTSLRNKYLGSSVSSVFNLLCGNQSLFTEWMNEVGALHDEWGFQSHCQLCCACCASPTCFGVDGEEILRVAGGDAVTQATGRGGEVGVLRLDADHRHVLRRVLHDDRVVDGIRGEGGVVVDIFYLTREEKKARRWGTQGGERGRRGPVICFNWIWIGNGCRCCCLSANFNILNSWWNAAWTRPGFGSGLIRHQSRKMEMYLPVNVTVVTL